MNAIEVSAVFKAYRSLLKPAQAALRGVDLAVPEGAAFGLIGPNGAGKTTFIKILLGIVFPDGGTVRVFGADPSRPATRAKVGYLPERLELPPSLSPRQYLGSVARLKGVSDAPAALDRGLERVGLSADAGRAMGGFSKGMRQRVGLAAALIGEPKLLVLDEPTDGLDPIARVAVRELLAEHQARGATLFLNSHLLAETERICDRVAILGAGRILQQGPLAELRAAAGGFRARFGGEPGASAEVLTGFGFSALGGGQFHFAGDPQALNAALDRARGAGALLLELNPGTRDLEELLSTTLQDAR